MSMQTALIGVGGRRRRWRAAAVRAADEEVGHKGLVVRQLEGIDAAGRLHHGRIRWQCQGVNVFHIGIGRRAKRNGETPVWGRRPVGVGEGAGGVGDHDQYAWHGNVAGIDLSVVVGIAEHEAAGRRVRDTETSG